MLRAVALQAISGYQRYLSPLKGWRCAYGAQTGRSSCSDFGRRAIAERGVGGGVRLLLRRFVACRAAALGLLAPADEQQAVDPTDVKKGRVRTGSGSPSARKGIGCDACGSSSSGDAGTTLCCAAEIVAQAAQACI